MKQIKKLFYTLLIASACIFIVPIVFPNIAHNNYTVQAATKIKLNSTKKTLVKGSTYTLKITGTSKKVKWSSSNKKVATVNSKGKVTAVGKGTATIKVKIGSKTYSCKVTVEAPYFSKSSVSINVAASIKTPLKGTSKTITYKSSNSNIAKVDKYGTVYGIKAGTVKITATVSGKSFTCSVTVKVNPSISGWKTIYGTKYYYINGAPATGLQTINNRKYFFNENGIITSKFGIDVSGWQKDIDWAKAKADGVQFAIIRCGYGMNQTDQDDTFFIKNISECKRLGIPFGVYLFSYADSLEKSESEADHVLRLVNGYNPSLGIWYDIEDDNTSGAVEKELLTNIINTFCNKITKNGYKVGIYASTSWLNDKIDASITSKYPIWVAQYYSACEYKGKYVMWQYTSNGAIDGISTKVDYNIMF